MEFHSQEANLLPNHSRSHMNLEVLIGLPYLSDDFHSGTQSNPTQFDSIHTKLLYYNNGVCFKAIFVGIIIHVA